MKKVNKKLMKKWSKRRGAEIVEPVHVQIDHYAYKGKLNTTLFTMAELYQGPIRVGVGITKRSPLDGEDQKRANTIATWRALDNAAGV